MIDNDPFGKTLPLLSAKRIDLRAPRAQDAQRILDIFGDPLAMKYWSHEPLSDLLAAETYLHECAKSFAERSLFQWAISESKQAELIGTVTLYQWNQVHRRVELGYMLAPSHWGRGLAREAVSTAIEFAFDTMKVHRIEADIDPRNLASAKLLQRLGFREEGLQKERFFTYGEWSDSALYGLVRSNS